jgi:hypothetical protein
MLNITMISMSWAKHHEHGIDPAANFNEGALAFKHPNPKGALMTKTFTGKTLKSAALALAVLIAGIAQASAQSGPTMQEKMACRADAEAFCSQFVGKAPLMRACLEQNKAKLSSPCRAVVEAHGG